MSSEKPVCGFCGRTCESDQDVGFLTFPDGQKKAAHLSHPGVKEEYERQQKK
jgi:hypothetical protein